MCGGAQRRLIATKFAALDHSAELFLGRMFVFSVCGICAFHFLVVHRKALEMNNTQEQAIAVVAVHFGVGLPDLSLFEFHLSGLDSEMPGLATRIAEEVLKGYWGGKSGRAYPTVAPTRWTIRYPIPA